MPPAPFPNYYTTDYPQATLQVIGSRILLKHNDEERSKNDAKA